jgi:hypothetical protein
MITTPNGNERHYQSVVLDSAVIAYSHEGISVLVDSR